MPLQLEIVSEHRDIVGDDAIREFREDGGTIGRALENDWILPDAEKYISGRHATIDYKGGAYYLMDTSSNGVYINDEIEPIGRGNPRRLFDGDRLRMGEFEINVSLDTGESLEMPAPPPPTVVPDHMEQLVDEVSLRTGMKLLDEEEITGDDEFQSALFGSRSGPIEQDVEEPRDEMPSRSMDDDSVRQSLEKLDRIANSGVVQHGIEISADDLFDSFLDGLGITRADLHASIDKAEVVQNAGIVMREFVAGITGLLASRANLKDTFALERTTVLPRHNNPLKLSENTSDLVKQLLVGKDGEYLGARDSVREACRDLLFHQNAVLDAMNSAFIEFADRFDPDELEDAFNNSMSGAFAKLFAKSKYWEMYRDLYPIMTEKGGGRFPQMFGEDFVSAYEQQIAEFLRLERKDGATEVVRSLTDTRKLDPQAEIAAFEEEALNDDSAIEMIEIDDDLLDEDEQVEA